jgi:hypothetical protein
VPSHASSLLLTARMVQLNPNQRTKDNYIEICTDIIP